MELKFILLILCLTIISNANFDERFPDAIRCGVDVVNGGDTAGSILFLHATDKNNVVYRQIYSGEDRYAIFNLDGSFNRSGGYPGTVNGCKDKSLKTIKQ